MSLPKIFCLILSTCLLFSFAGCGKKSPTVEELEGASSTNPQVQSEITSSESEPTALNPLTGEMGLDLSRENKRPVAIMINNISVAQRVQTGIGEADLVFETEVEGGITRLMAVFQDPSKVAGSIGTIRSARTVFADIANGLDAFYVHHGSDDKYCTPHMKSLGIIHGNIGTPYATRQSNGLSTEHTLYTTGTNLLTYMQKSGYDKNVTVKSFANFASEAVTPAEYECSFVRVPFSASYVTDFIYNEETGKYARGKQETPLKDYSTGKTEEFTNVFVLKTTMSFYADNYHRTIDLSSGEGFYISNGGCESIKWEKGSSANSFTFKKADGSALTVNPGNSYICITKTSNKITVR